MAISKVNVTTAATLVSAARPYGRSWFVLQNQSDTDIYVSFDGTAAVTLAAGNAPGILIAAGETFAFAASMPTPRPPVDAAIYAIHGGSGNKVLVCHEV